MEDARPLACTNPLVGTRRTGHQEHHQLLDQPDANPAAAELCGLDGGRRLCHQRRQPDRGRLDCLHHHQRPCLEPDCANLGPHGAVATIPNRTARSGCHHGHAARQLARRAPHGAREMHGQFEGAEAELWLQRRSARLDAGELEHLQRRTCGHFGCGGFGQNVLDQGFVGFVQACRGPRVF